MSQIADTIHFCFEHIGAITTLITIAITIARLTEWGRNNQRALDAVTRAIEDINDRPLKHYISNSTHKAHWGTRDALHAAIARADASREADGPLKRAKRYIRHRVRHRK